MGLARQRAGRVALLMVGAVLMLSGSVGDAAGATKGAPDLAAVSVASPPRQSRSGATRRVRVVVANRGRRPAGRSSLAVYLSTNATWSSVDQRVGTATVPLLASGKRATVTVAVRL